MKYEKKVILIHLFLCTIITLLSLLGLFFSNWELVTCVGISSLFAVLYFACLLKSSNLLDPQLSKGATSYVMFTFLRFLIVAVGILIPTLIIFLTNNSNDKYRYLNVIGATIPFLSVNFILLLIRREND